MTPLAPLPAWRRPPPGGGGRARGTAGGVRPGSAAPDARYRFLARFGATILAGGIAAIPTSLYHYQAELGLVPQEVWFVCYILAHRWTDALPYPSLRQMSRRSGISTQMLHRYKQSLDQKGYLATIPRHRPSGSHLQLLRLQRPLRPPGAAPPPRPARPRLAAHRGRGRRDGRKAAAPLAHLCQRVNTPAPPDVLAWGDVIAAGRQRALSAPPQPQTIGAGAGGRPPALNRHHPPRIQDGAIGIQIPCSKTRRRDPAPGRPRDAETGSLTGTAGKSGTRNAIGERGQGTISETSRGGNRGTGRTNGTNGTRRTEGTRAEFPPPPHRTSSPDPADARWASACRILAAELTPAAVSAWLRPLTPVALAPAPDRGGQLLVLACNTAFHRDHVLRRYRAAIERAAGAACEVVVRPGAARERHPGGPSASGLGPRPRRRPRPALALAPAPAPAPPPPLRR